MATDRGTPARGTAREGGPGPLLLALVVLVTAAALVVLTVTAAPGDRGIPEERIEQP